MFKGEDESARFAERINARSKGDPNDEVKSMSVLESAKDEHAAI